jgi:hypothetical protein
VEEWVALVKIPTTSMKENDEEVKKWLMTAYALDI